MTFPLAKLGFLLMKQLSKPLANFIKNEAKAHPFFRRYFCQSSARAYMWLESGYKRREQRPTLTEEEEVELGANLMGEVILFSLLSVILYMELSRQGDKKASKEKMKADEFSNVVENVSDILDEIDAIKRTLSKLEKKLEDFDAVSDFDVREYIEQAEPHPSEIHFRDYMQHALRKMKAVKHEPLEGVDGDPYSP
ncbi:UNVERIFIED_CONTAM: hypothetical protein PYX00_007249 [Menopon gallinae]|uniref:OPA3-like protein n=1 Tax=Menopon gallinae TaxID=328185 RepID=A0AAW2HIS1_9NEOP